MAKSRRDSKGNCLFGHRSWMLAIRTLRRALRGRIMLVNDSISFSGNGGYGRVMTGLRRAIADLDATTAREPKSMYIGRPVKEITVVPLPVPASPPEAPRRPSKPLEPIEAPVPQEPLVPV